MEFFLKWPNQQKRIQKVGGEVEEFVLTNYILMQLKKYSDLIFCKKIYDKYLCLIKNF